MEILLSALCNTQIGLHVKKKIIALAVLDLEISPRQTSKVTKKHVLRKLRKTKKTRYIYITALETAQYAPGI